jgi:hypothetical protein
LFKVETEQFFLNLPFGNFHISYFYDTKLGGTQGKVCDKNQKVARHSRRAEN